MREATVENPLRLAVFISGSGSGMAALLRHQESKPCLHETTLVVSNVADVSGLAKAAAHNVKTITIELEATISDAKERRETHETAIMAALEQHNIEAVILSGYMRILSPRYLFEHGRGGCSISTLHYCQNIPAPTHTGTPLLMGQR